MSISNEKYYDSYVSWAFDDICQVCRKKYPPKGGHPECTAKFMADRYKRETDATRLWMLGVIARTSDACA